MLSPRANKTPLPFLLSLMLLAGILFEGQAVVRLERLKHALMRQQTQLLETGRGRMEQDFGRTQSLLAKLVDLSRIDSGARAIVMKYGLMSEVSPGPSGATR